MSQLEQTGPDRNSKVRVWAVTINSPSENSLEQLAQYHGVEYLFQEERAPTTGQLHLQGCLRFANPVRFNTVQGLLPNAHIERARKPWKAQIAYCTKDVGRRYTNILSLQPVRDPLEGVILYTWQRNLLAILEQPPHPRTIYYIWDQAGNTGKSSFIKSVCLKDRRQNILVSGSSKDMQYACSLIKGGPKIVMIDIPRSVEHVSWGGIEGIKNGCYFSPKYESNMVLFDPPHVCVFANEPPPYAKMSYDRWEVIHADRDDFLYDTTLIL